MSKKVFIAYAHQDEKLYRKLLTQLAQLQREGLIRIMPDIDPGVQWANVIDTNLNEAEIILLLISPDFLASDYCYNEMNRAIERDKAQAAHVIPIILRPCDWEATPIGKMPVLPQGGGYVDSDRHNLDEALSSIVQRIRELIPNDSGKTSNRIMSSPSLASAEQSRVQPIPLPGSKDNSYTHKKLSFQRKTIFLGLLIGCLIFAGSGVAVFRVWEDFSHPNQGTKTATTTAQTCPKEAATLPGASSYNAAIAKSGIQFGFNAQHTRTNPYENILNPDNVWKLQQKWAYLIGSNMDTSPPVVANGLVYVGSQDGKLYAFDAATGQKKGFANVGDSTSSSPTIANGLIYIGSDNGNLYVFDSAIAGQSNWVPKWVGSTNPSTRTKQRGIASSPAIANGLVYVSSRDGKLYTFDASTGQPKWSMRTGAIHDSSPAVADNLVYIGSWENHSLYAFDAATGHQQWVASTGDAIYSSPAVANGLVYIGSRDGRLYAFSLP